MVLLKHPLPVILEYGPDKVSGFVMQLTAVGIMVELEKIPFKVGTFLNANIQLKPNINVIEKVRAIKHYDKFYRTAPKKLNEGEAPVASKMLCELHFQLLSEANRVAISKHLMRPETET